MTFLSSTVASGFLSTIRGRRAAQCFRRLSQIFDLMLDALRFMDKLLFFKSEGFDDIHDSSSEEGTLTVLKRKAYGWWRIVAGSRLLCCFESSHLLP